MNEDDSKSGDRRDGGRPTNGRRDDARPTPNNAFRPRRDDRPDSGTPRGNSDRRDGNQRDNKAGSRPVSRDGGSDRRSDDRDRTDRPRPAFDRDRNAGNSASRPDRSGTSRFGSNNNTPNRREEYPKPKFNRSAGGSSFGGQTNRPRRDDRNADDRPRFSDSRRDADPRSTERPTPRFNRDGDRPDTNRRDTARPTSRFSREADPRDTNQRSGQTENTNQERGHSTEEPRQRSGENRFGQERRYQERPTPNRSADSRDSRPDNREDRSRNSERPRSFDRNDRPGSSDRNDRPNRDERPRSFDRNDRPGSSDRNDRPNRDERPRSFDRNDRPNRDERPSRDERPRSFDRSGEDNRPTQSVDKPYAGPDSERNTATEQPKIYDQPLGSRPENRRDEENSGASDRESRTRDDRNEKPAARRSGISSDERRVGKYDRAPNYDADAMRKSIPHKKREQLERAEKHDNRNTEGGTIRLNRYIANAGICSRREADELIAQGTVQVNGTVVTEMGHQVQPGDVVKYGNRILNPEKMVYVLLNKPKDYITTTDDPEERRTVMELVADAGPFRIYPVGRLDRNTTGLMLMTNDGELAEKLTHPSHEIKKIYQVELDKPITDEHFEAIQAGFDLEDGPIKPDGLSVVTPDAQVIGIEIHSGRNRIVRRIFENFGYEVTKLDRTSYAGLNKKDLPRGTWRFLEPKEVVKLKYLQ